MKYKIFISGVQKELKGERRAIKNYIMSELLLAENFDVFLFEDFPAKSKSAENAYLGEVGSSDIYVGVFGRQYGKQRGVSPTEAEFREAKRKNKHILIYIKGNSAKDKDREPGMRNLLKEIRDTRLGYSYKRFTNKNDLCRQLYASLFDFLKEKGVVSRGAFDERVCSGADWDDIDKARVRWFVGVARSQRGFPLTKKTPIKDIFTHLDLLQNDKLTNAAVLLFGKNPHRFFLQAEVKCVQQIGTEIEKPFASYKVYSGNLFEQVDSAVNFVLDILKQAVIQQVHTPQFKRPFEIPPFVIQEAIVNAVAHRNYNTTAGVQVMVFSDRVEIWNSGGLPPELDLEDLRKPHSSYPPNPLVTNVLYLADYIQRLGTGTVEMIKQCREQEVPEPEFNLKRNLEFRTILSRNIYISAKLENRNLNDRQNRAVRLTREKGWVCLADLKSYYPNTVERTLNRDLQRLVDQNILKASGKKKGRRYSF